MRHRTFFSLAEANAAVAEALERINGHLVRRHPASPVRDPRVAGPGAAADRREGQERTVFA